MTTPSFLFNNGDYIVSRSCFPPVVRRIVRVYKRNPSKPTYEWAYLIGDERFLSSNSSDPQLEDWLRVDEPEARRLVALAERFGKDYPDAYRYHYTERHRQYSQWLEENNIK